MTAQPPRDGLQERLKVIGTQGDQVQLQARPVSGCAGCAARGHCGVSALNTLIGARAPVLTLPGQARPGQEVVVTLPARAFLIGVTLAFLLPAAALALGAVGLSVLGLSDAAVALLCLPLLALALWPLRRLERRGRLAGQLRIVPDGRSQGPT